MALGGIGDKNWQVSGERHYRWNGGRYVASSGYAMVKAEGHPRANRDGYVREHILVVEKALGKPLPEGSEVHHANGNRSDNSSGNLVICQDHGYHVLLEQRTRAVRAGFPAHYLKCTFCKQYDDPKNLSGKTHYHVSCRKAYRLSGRWNRRNSKLTFEQVAEVRAAISAGETSVAIAARYGVSTCTISNIKTNRRWRVA